jgi:RHS repeat-associated protein
MNNTGTNDIGLTYMRARFYAPELRRFISADTIVPEPGNPQSFNRYAYVHNDAINDYLSEHECKSDHDCADDLFAQWQQDTEWWEMIRFAEAGDILTGRTPVGAFYLKFTGLGQDLLTGYERVAKNGGNVSEPSYFLGLDLFEGMMLRHIQWGKRVFRSDLDLSGTMPVVYTWGVLVRTDSEFGMFPVYKRDSQRMMRFAGPGGSDFVTTFGMIAIEEVGEAACNAVSLGGCGLVIDLMGGTADLVFARDWLASRELTVEADFFEYYPGATLGYTGVAIWGDTNRIYDIYRGMR